MLRLLAPTAIVLLSALGARSEGAPIGAISFTAAAAATPVPTPPNVCHVGEDCASCLIHEDDKDPKTETRCVWCTSSRRCVYAGAISDGTCAKAIGTSKSADPSMCPSPTDWKQDIFIATLALLGTVVALYAVCRLRGDKSDMSWAKVGFRTRTDSALAEQAQQDDQLRRAASGIGGGGGGGGGGGAAYVPPPLPEVRQTRGFTFGQGGAAKNKA